MTADAPLRIDAVLIAKLANEAASATSLVVRNVASIGADALLILLGEREGPRILARILIATATGRARVQLVPARRKEARGAPDAPNARDARADEAAPDAFAEVLARELVGTRLDVVRAVPGERIVELRFEASDGRVRKILAELFGARPDVALLDADDRILGVRHGRSGARPLSRGARYRLPPSRTPAPSVEATEARDAAGAPDAPDAPDAPGAGAASPPMPPPDIDPTFAAEHPWSAAAAHAFESIDRTTELRVRLARVASRLRAERARCDSLLEALAGDRAAADAAPRLREIADVLAASFVKLKRGMHEVRAEDFYRGGEIVIDLDPKLDPAGNVARKYGAVEKLERSGPHVDERIVATRLRQSDLDALRLRIDAANARLDAQNARLEAPSDSAAAAATRQGPLPDAPLGGIDEILARATALGLLERARGRDLASRKAEKLDRALDGLHRFELASGNVALVGRTDADNDRLTHRIARSHDVWLHVQGYPGSHVVLRVPKGKTASLEDLLAAGQLAVHFSKRRGDARAQVTWTPKKFVRRGRGRAGLAIVERSKTLEIDHDPVLLRTLLSGGR